MANRLTDNTVAEERSVSKEDPVLSGAALVLRDAPLLRMRAQGETSAPFCILSTVMAGPVPAIHVFAAG